ncbi:MAG: hypothetical protein RI983_1909 [Bacteroidota bacterium]|jgi:DNA uptake protein ComE-like DNA-binding protein
MKDYLSFSQKERIGLLGLLLIFGSLMGAPYFLSESPEPLNPADLEWTNNVSYRPSFDEKDSSLDKGSVGFTVKYRRINFDPNSASREMLLQLGFSEKNIKTLTNYIQKGGKLKAAKDLYKIWGMRKELVDTLLPYIRIASIKDSELSFDNKRLASGLQSYPKRTPQKIDINTADQAAWEQLPGIGPVLASRIIKYRNRLGTFSSVEEIRKTYGLSDSVFNLIQPLLQIHPGNASAISEPLTPNQLPSINTASEALLIKAGINPAIASAIVLYRNQYGLFSQLEDLRKIVFIQAAQYEELIKQVKL